MAVFRYLVGDVEGAIAQYLTAAGRTTSLAEQIYLTTRAARLKGSDVTEATSAANGGPR